MELAAWRAQPYGNEPPASVASLLSERDLQFVLSDKEVQRARRVNKAQSTMKAVQYKRRMMLKDLDTAPEVHGLVYDETKQRWIVKEQTRRVVGGNGAVEEVGARSVNEEVTAPTIEDGMAEKLHSAGTVDKANNHEPTPGGEVQQPLMVHGETHPSQTPKNPKSANVPPIKPLPSSAPSSTPANSPTTSRASKKTKQVHKQKAAPRSTTPPPRSHPSKQTMSSKVAGKGQPVQEDSLRSRILGWLKGGW